MKRTFDFAVALVLLVFLFPIFLIVAVLIKLDSSGPVFYKQSRVGKGMHIFKLYKFRTMKMLQVSNSSLTIGAHDPRVTAVGYWLRKYKIDELPQLINVLLGDMSLVGPRPELMKYVRLYNRDQQRVLSVKPGITDWASIQFCNESDLLEQAEEPENYYIREIIPAKLSRSLQYIDHHDLWIDIKIIALTLLRVIKN